MKVSPRLTLRFWSFLSLGLVVVLVLMPLHAFLSTYLGTAIGPLWLWKSWKEIWLVVLTLTTLGYILWRRQTRAVFSDPIILMMCTYAILVMAVTYGGDADLDAKAAGVAMDLRYLVIFGLAYLLARYAPEIRTNWLRKAPRLLIIAGIILATLGVLQVTVTPLNFLERFGYDKDTTISPYLLIDDNPEAPRAFATMRGPNDYGAYLILPLVMIVAYLIKARDKLLLGLIVTAGLAVSASRSAWLGALAAIGAALFDAKRMLTRRMMLIGSAGVVVLLVGLTLAVSVPSVRLAVFHSSPGDSSLTEGSTDAHLQATLNGIERVIAAPLGCGAGCAGPASYYGSEARISENYYVQVAETYGAAGFVLWTTIFGLVMYRLWKHDEKLSVVVFAAGVGYALIGFWLHVWSDDPVSLTWWALAGIVLGNLPQAGKVKAKALK